MEFNIDAYAKRLILHIGGIFTFSDHGKFQQIATTISGMEPGSELVIDLSGLERIDSSAIGMLIMGVQDCHEQGVTLSVVNVKPPVQLLFKMAKLERFFNLDSGTVAIRASAA